MQTGLWPEPTLASGANAAVKNHRLRCWALCPSLEIDDIAELKRRVFIAGEQCLHVHGISLNAAFDENLMRISKPPVISGDNGFCQSEVFRPINRMISYVPENRNPPPLTGPAGFALSRHIRLVCLEVRFGLGNTTREQKNE